LDEKLSRAFTPDEIFRASRSIQPGESYIEMIGEALKECEVLLVLIGPGWTRRADQKGVPLLSRADDWVRVEIATALSHNARVIPVLLSHATRLDETELPADIASLAHRQYIRFEYRTVDEDFSRLVDTLRPERARQITDGRLGGRSQG
jgi:hypothetical protein